MQQERQQQQHPFRTTPRAVHEETLRFQDIPSSRMEPEQSSLYRRHTKPFESWEPFFSSPFLYLFPPIFSVSLLPAALPSFLPPTRSAAPLSFAEQLFSQLGVLLHDRAEPVAVFFGETSWRGVRSQLPRIFICGCGIWGTLSSMLRTAPECLDSVLSGARFNGDNVSFRFTLMYLDFLVDTPDAVLSVILQRSSEWAAYL